MPEMEPTEPRYEGYGNGLSEGMQSLANMPSFSEHMAGKEAAAGNKESVIEDKENVAENKDAKTKYKEAVAEGVKNKYNELVTKYGGERVWENLLDTVEDVLETAYMYREYASGTLKNAKKILESGGHFDLSNGDVYVPVFDFADVNDKQSYKLCIDNLNPWDDKPNGGKYHEEELEDNPEWNKDGYPAEIRLRKAKEYEEDYELMAKLLVEEAKGYIETAEEQEGDVAEAVAEKQEEAKKMALEIDDLLVKNEEDHTQPSQGVEK